MRALAGCLGVTAALLLGGCRGNELPLFPGDDGPRAGEAESVERPEAVSLLGTELFRPSFEGERLEKLRADLAEAERAHAAAPNDPEAAIWHGRRLAYLGRYGDAVEVYTQALGRHPESAKLMRHRGHRMITLRRFEVAERDLSAAAELMAGRPDEIEPDGAPNASGIPRSTLQSNIWYHLGLSQYLQGDFESALASYTSCREFARVNDDMFVAASYWYVLTLVRLDREADAQAALAEIREDMDVLENHAYHHLLLLFQGERTEAQVLGGEGGEESVPGLELATRGYGLSVWLRSRGETERARTLLERIVDETAWPAFGHLAAEADLASGALR